MNKVALYHALEAVLQAAPYQTQVESLVEDILDQVWWDLDVEEQEKLNNRGEDYDESDLLGG